MEPIHFKILLVVLVVAYKAWEYLRNAARNKSEEARNVPVPTGIEQLPWEDPVDPTPSPDPTPAPAASTSTPRRIERRQEPLEATYLPTPPAAELPVPSEPPAPVGVGPTSRKAAASHRIREWMIGQVILGKPLALSPRRGGSAVRR